MPNKRTEKAITAFMDAIKEQGSIAGDELFVMIGELELRVKVTPRSGNVQFYLSNSDQEVLAQFSLNSIVKKRYPRRKK